MRNIHWMRTAKHDYRIVHWQVCVCVCQLPANQTKLCPAGFAMPSTCHHAAYRCATHVNYYILTLWMERQFPLKKVTARTRFEIATTPTHTHTHTVSRRPPWNAVQTHDTTRPGIPVRYGRVCYMAAGGVCGCWALIVLIVCITWCARAHTHTHAIYVCVRCSCGRNGAPEHIDRERDRVCALLFQCQCVQRRPNIIRLHKLIITRTKFSGYKFAWLVVVVVVARVA